MKRIVLTDESGKWFDADSARHYPERTRWNGNNHISVPTGSQWDHEALYYTASGRWVLNEWSQYQGTLETYTEISEADAVAWLAVNDHFDELEELPASVRDSIEKQLEALEV